MVSLQFHASRRSWTVSALASRALPLTLAQCTLHSQPSSDQSIYAKEIILKRNEYCEHLCCIWWENCALTRTHALPGTLTTPSTIA